MRILVVEDDGQVRKMVCKVLGNQGYDFVEAANGKEVFKILKNKVNIKIVVADIIMPEKDGLEIIQELKRDYPDIKILAISGGGKISAQNYLVLAQKVGADLILKKPFNKQELLDAIKKLENQCI
jgi:CheY-like chemotaxis protein